MSQSGHQSWQYIMGDWLAAMIPGANINDYTQPPTTAHIAWTRPINFGGVGGQPLAIDSGGDNYYSYLSYEGMFQPPIIMHGRLYYNTPNPPEYGFQCVDLLTGEQIWYNNGTQDPLATQQLGFGFAKQNYPQLSFGQELDYESPNQHGLISYLWVTYTLANGSNVWAMYDPFSGNWICDIVGVPAGAAIFGASSTITDQIGSYLIFSFSPDFKTVTVWNSTQCIQNTNPSLSVANGYWMWRPPLGGIVSANSGLTIYNTTGVPAAFQQTTIGFFGPSNSMGLSLLGIDKQNQIAVYSNATALLGMASFPTPNAIASMGISIAPDSMGQYKWSKIIPYPPGNVTLLSGFVGEGVYSLFIKELTQWITFSSTTGEQLWTSPSEVSLHSYGVTGGIYNGVLYSGDSIGEGGVIYAYDITNGNLLWQTTPTSMGNNGYWDYVPMSVGTFAAGNIYWYGSEHSPGPSLEPGFKIGAVNATTGEPLWNITFWNAGGGFGAGIPIADGYMTALNAYDNQIYAFGKDATSITMQQPLTAAGQRPIVTGRIIDLSPGTKQTAIAMRFPQGVPVVSDKDQTAWMEYVYMQNPEPTDVTGVPIILTFVDSNGNAHVDTVMTDATGAFSYSVPSDMVPIEGKYTITASFSGSGAYWPSKTQTTLLMGSEAAPTPTATPPSSLADLYFVPAIVGLAVLIIIIGVIVVLLLLRKR
ncbi:MAG: PQQ-binding-like beta-propeller repeat protein [Candidatus Bathyarchaeota archaeon]|nr:PQQ-binding-like beta-propeller repeat protein [Candidatus Bathyarchaeota archaeon]